MPHPGAGFAKIYIHFCIIIMEASLRFPVKTGILTGGHAQPYGGAAEKEL
jgi:hypothetical protein